MNNEKYEELDRLSKKNKIGIFLIIIFILFIFIIPSAIVIIYENISDYYLFPPLIISIIGTIIIYKMFCRPYNDKKRLLYQEVKKNLLQKEINNTFNNTYKEEDIENLLKELQDLYLRSVKNEYYNDYFSAIYNNVKFNYVDFETDGPIDDDTNGPSAFFKGSLLTFSIKTSIGGDLYIGKKGMILSDIDGAFKTKNKKITPNNNLLNDNIIIKSNDHPSIIENNSFQQALNDLITEDNEYMLVYKNNKLYVFINNRDYAFEFLLDKKEDETVGKERIIEGINVLKTELDKILKYKEELNIKEEI